MIRILVIDDEPINHQLVAHALEPLSMQFILPMTVKAVYRWLTISSLI